MRLTANQKGLMPLRKNWTIFGGFLHLNLRFSGHSCFYQTDRIGLVAAGGKLVTVKVVLTKESQAPPKMLMSVEIFSQNVDVNGKFLLSFTGFTHCMKLSLVGKCS